MSRCKEHLEETCRSFPNCYGCNNFGKPTQYDRIISMTIEEIAVAIDKLTCLCASGLCSECPIHKSGHHCRPQDIMDWLRSEVKEKECNE